MQTNFSAHMLKTFENCPIEYCFAYEKHISIPQDTSLSQKGKNLHALINFYLKGFDIKRLADSLNEEESKLWENFLSLKLDQTNAFASEYTFNVKLNTTIEKTPPWLTGRIDAIFLNNNKYQIFDWKTGKIPKNAKEDLQTSFYLVAMFEILKAKNLISEFEQLEFIYVNLATLESEIIQNSKELYETQKNRIIKLIDSTSKYNFNKNPKQDEKCCLCKFKTICKTDVFL